MVLLSGRRADLYSPCACLPASKTSSHAPPRRRMRAWGRCLRQPRLPIRRLDKDPPLAPKMDFMRPALSRRTNGGSRSWGKACTLAAFREALFNGHRYFAGAEGGSQLSRVRVAVGVFCREFECRSKEAAPYSSRSHHYRLGLLVMLSECGASYVTWARRQQLPRLAGKTRGGSSQTLWSSAQQWQVSRSCPDPGGCIKRPRTG